MKIIELFNELALGELSNLDIAHEGVIKEPAIPKVINAANEALLKLYSKFLLSERNLFIQVHKHITNYHLLKRFATSQSGISTEPYLYILDNSNEVFEEDVIRIFDVYLNHTVKLPINDQTNPLSVYTPQYNIIQYPDPKDNEQLTVIYQAKPKLLKEENLNTELFDVPWFLMDGLKSYIAYKIFTNINTLEATNKAMEHMNRFEVSCAEALTNGLVQTVEPTVCNKFKVGGWL